MSKKILGLVLEINPFHTGHKYFIDKAIEIIKPDYVIAIVSPSFSMRGDVSIMDKFTKTELLLDNNIDLVLELPFIGCNASSDYFAINAIKALSKFNITHFACGGECDDINILNDLSDITNSQEFNNYVNKYLQLGCSYSLSNNKALLEYTNNLDYINNFSLPNNRLAISYINSFKKLNINPNITIIKRIDNNYYDEKLGNTFSSATSLRKEINSNWKNAQKFLIDKNYNYINSDEFLNKIFLIIKERFIIFGAPYMENILGISEGIENRIQASINKAKNYNELIELSITKRYPENKIKRILLNILFDVKKNDFKNNEIDYLRILGFNEKGNKLIKTLDKNIKNEIITSLKNTNNPISILELKVTKLYGLLINNDELYLKEFQVPIKK